MSKGLTIPQNKNSDEVKNNPRLGTVAMKLADKFDNSQARCGVMHD